MRTIRIITAVIKHDEKILILKRSNNVKTMKGLWSAVSGIIEGDEDPQKRAEIEIQEEIGVAKKDITLIKAAQKNTINSPQYPNSQWEILPFLFEVKNTEIRLNWENCDFRWINIHEIQNYNTVPDLSKILFDLL